MNIKIDEITIIDITTIFLAIATFILAYHTYGIINDTQKGRKIIFFKRKVEKLYFPLQSIFEKFDIKVMVKDIAIIADKERNIGDRATLCESSIIGRYISFKRDLEQINPFWYLASEDLKYSLKKLNEIFENNKIFIEVHNRDQKVNVYQKLCEILDNHIKTLDDKKIDMISLYEKIKEIMDKDISSYNIELNKLLK